MTVSHVFLLSNGEFYREQSERRMNLHTTGLEVLVDEVNTHKGKQRNKKNKEILREKCQYIGRAENVWGGPLI